MAMELKGLKGKALRARASIDAIGKAYDAFNSDASAHLADVKAIASDLTEMQDDLGAATRILGNSVAGSGEPQDSPAPPPPSTPSPPPPTPPAPPQEQQAAITMPAMPAGRFDTPSPPAPAPEQPPPTENAPAAVSESFSTARTITETANKSAGSFHDVYLSAASGQQWGADRGQ